MKRFATLLSFLVVCVNVMFAQTVINNEAFSFSYDAKIWEPLNTDVFFPEGFFYQALQRRDGTGAVFVMSSVEDKNLVTYAATTLRTNSMYAQGYTDLEECTIDGRRALKADFKYGDNLGRVWFFQEGGRLLSFSIMDKKSIEREMPILHALKIHPVQQLLSDEISEAEMIATFRNVSNSLKLLKDEAETPEIRMTSLRIDPEGKKLECVFTTTLVAQARELLRNKADIFAPSIYERRALELGYTLTWIYVDTASREIGRVSFTKEDLRLLLR